MTTPIDDHAVSDAASMTDEEGGYAGAPFLLEVARSVGVAVDDPPPVADHEPDATTLVADREPEPQRGEPEEVVDPASKPSRRERRRAAKVDDDGNRVPFRRRRRKTTVVLVAMAVLLVPLTISYARAVTAPGSESLEARSVGWLRDLHLGFVVDRVEQAYYERDQFADGGTPTVGIAPVVSSPGSTASESTTAPPTSTATPTTIAATTTTLPPHLAPPAPMATPAAQPLPDEGQWFPVGPTNAGLPGVYVTKVRPNAQKSSLLVFVAWVDPKLVQVKLFPGTALPGGQWNTPNYLNQDYCTRAIMASNGGFRMDQSRGGYYAEGYEMVPLRDGAASLIFFKDGTVDVAEWGRDYTRADLDRIESVRQNLELMADGGAPAPRLDSTDWGALLANSTYVWRSGYGVTADGALLYAGGPAMTPGDLVRTLTNAGAVRVMEGDINPDWVVANLYTVDANGTCVGTSGLPGSSDQGGFRSGGWRYLSVDSRDFVAVLAKP